MKRKPILISCFIFLTIVTGCLNSVNRVSTIASVSQTPIIADASFLKHLTITPSLPNTIQVVASSAVPVSTETPYQATSQAEINCVEVVSAISSDIVSSGFVLMEKGYELYSLDMHTGQSSQISLPNERLHSLSISPDKTLFAFRSIFVDVEGNALNRNLVIANAYGQRLKEIVWDEAWDKLIGWDDNQRLIFQLARNDKKDEQICLPGPWLVLDPFGENQQILPQDLLPGWDDWYAESYNYVRQPECVLVHREMDKWQP